MENDKFISKQIKKLLEENYTLSDYFDKRIKKYANSVNQNWEEIKEYFLINTDGEKDVYFKALDIFLSSEGF